MRRAMASFIGAFYNPAVHEIAERRDIDRETFAREIAAQYAPVVLRGLVSDWPAVRAGRESPRAIHEYLARFDKGHPVDVLITPPHVRGRIFYNDAMDGFNYAHEKVALSTVSEKLVRHAK